MGFFSSLFGDDAAKASKAAAADTYGKQQGAIQKLLGYGDEYKAGMDENAQAYNPFIQTGLTANNAYQNLLADPSSVRSLPGYQFQQQEGQRAIDRSGAARGMDASGRTLKDLLRFSQGTADQSYGNQLSRLLGGTQLGLGATGGQVGVEGQGLQGQLGARQTAYGGDMTSAGTIGQGDIAAANAQASGTQNILNSVMKLGGVGLGSLGFGGAFGQGGFFGSPFKTGGG